VYQGFIQYIKAGNKEVSDIKILNLLSDCEEKLNIKTRVELSCNPLIASPMLIGFFRPRIILPSHEWEDKELSYIFVHELIHY
ncbi:M56 family metallopeptidase, partial [Escherichia coli]|uniref:M56 family metallopeptidase n=1 Tax=Escherichia coli TaxID=562 RepID=UPI00390C6F02